MTYEEFFALVKELFLECVGSVSEDDVDEYFEENSDLIEREYEKAFEQYHKGIITRAEFRSDCALAVAKNLYLSF